MRPGGGTPRKRRRQWRLRSSREVPRPLCLPHPIRPLPSPRALVSRGDTSAASSPPATSSVRAHRPRWLPDRRRCSAPPLPSPLSKTLPLPELQDQSFYPFFKERKYSSRKLLFAAAVAEMAPVAAALVGGVALTYLVGKTFASSILLRPPHRRTPPPPPLPCRPPPRPPTPPAAHHSRPPAPPPSSASPHSRAPSPAPPSPFASPELAGPLARTAVALRLP
ncbi:hypothetical protein SEVIR_1G121932v4 [Setaria viridis]